MWELIQKRYDRKKKFIKNDKSQNEAESVGTTANPDFTDKLNFQKLKHTLNKKSSL
ncbi:hypothetical protein LEP1GSC116_2821 [Leptospira interrogans serovar Icterohaemorrhagiae str. Verdun HP]|uniref:Uncharacterized protein n=1 Tax=Leptospira interrogans serovar Icterohaemorrhagiae str. Verdun HP TaxID=1049910 RepID=M6RW88_LEPIR|nr:hypothetical protein LEP1GSC116_2821 [Leptospira interrogans serovar Icterohaemorrhagiae str. Verdun HP]